MPRRTQHGVQSEVHVRDDVAREDDRHVVAGIARRGLAGTEKVEHGGEEHQHSDAEQHADDEVQHHHVAQHALRRLVVALPQAHRHQRRGAHAHQRTESGREVHQRKGQRQTRDGQRPHAVADEDAVHHII